MSLSAAKVEATSGLRPECPLVGSGAVPEDVSRCPVTVVAQVLEARTIQLLLPSPKLIWTLRAGTNRCPTRWATAAKRLNNLRRPVPLVAVKLLGTRVNSAAALVSLSDRSVVTVPLLPSLRTVANIGLASAPPKAVNPVPTTVWSRLVAVVGRRFPVPFARFNGLLTVPAPTALTNDNKVPNYRPKFRLSLVAPLTVSKAAVPRR